MSSSVPHPFELIKVLCSSARVQPSSSCYFKDSGHWARRQELWEDPEVSSKCRVRYAAASPSIIHSPEIISFLHPTTDGLRSTTLLSAYIERNVTKHFQGQCSATSCLLQSMVPRSMRVPSSTVSQAAVTRLGPFRRVVLNLWAVTPHGPHIRYFYYNSYQ